MRCSIIYASQSGNTALLAQAIRGSLPGGTCAYFGPPAPEALEAELLFVGFWTDKGSCCAPIADLLPRLSGKRAALFGTAGFGGAQRYFDGILERARALLPAAAPYAGGWMCQGKMSPSVRERYAALLEKAPGDERIRGMLENFDLALPHPDAADLAGAAAWAKACFRKETEV